MEVEILILIQLYKKMLLQLFILTKQNRLGSNSKFMETGFLILVFDLMSSLLCRFFSFCWFWFYSILFQVTAAIEWEPGMLLIEKTDHLIYRTLVLGTIPLNQVQSMANPIMYPMMENKQSGMMVTVGMLVWQMIRVQRELASTLILRPIARKNHITIGSTLIIPMIGCPLNRDLAFIARIDQEGFVRAYKGITVVSGC